MNRKLVLAIFALTIITVAVVEARSRRRVVVIVDDGFSESSPLDGYAGQTP